MLKHVQPLGRHLLKPKARIFSVSFFLHKKIPMENPGDFVSTNMKFSAC